jgi:CRISPR-associated endonuclease Cas1
MRDGDRGCEMSQLYVNESSAHVGFEANRITVKQDDGVLRSLPIETVEGNSMLSLGYSILLNEVYGAIEAKGLNPYFGFLHKDREKHPTLASDLMEEWRPVIIDSTVMGLVNGHEISPENFEKDSETCGIFIDKQGMKIIITKFEKKLMTNNRRLWTDDSTTSEEVIII